MHSWTICMDHSILSLWGFRFIISGGTVLPDIITMLVVGVFRIIIVAFIKCINRGIHQLVFFQIFHLPLQTLQQSVRRF